jgi:hypothetical protein
MANSSLLEAAAPCRYRYAQTRCPFASAVNNSAVTMSDIKQSTGTVPNHIDAWQKRGDDWRRRRNAARPSRWCGLLPSLVGAEGDQDGPVIA